MKRIKAQLWDKTQFFLSNFYDRMMHFATFYDGDIDIDILRIALKKVVDNIPVLHSRYVSNVIKPYWKTKNDYSLKELASKEIVSDLESSTYDFLKGYISHKSKLQFRCKVFKAGEKCSFALLVNHQCFDGADFKYVVCKIVECYNAYIKTKNLDNVEIKNGNRDLKQLYENMDSQIAKKAKRLYNNASKTGIKKKFKFTDDKNCSKRFIIRDINEKLFLKIKQKCKECGSTINDLLLTCYFRAVVKEAHYKMDEPINITSMIDLRRHMLNGSTTGITNMTAFMPCKLEQGVGESFEETLSRVVKVTSSSKHDDVVGLYGIPLLNFAYKVFVFDALARFIIKIGYENPLLQMSNIGVIKSEGVNFYNCNMYECFITGAVKYKPFFQLTCATQNNHLKLVVAEKCSDEDEKLIQSFMDDVVSQIKRFAQ